MNGTTETLKSRYLVWITLLLTLLYAAGLHFQKLFFGAPKGGGIYPYISPMTMTIVMAGVIAAAAVYYLSKFLLKIENEKWFLAAAILTGMAVQALLAWKLTFPMGELVKSAGGNSFYGGALAISWNDIFARCAQYRDLLPQFPHTHTAMAGHLVTAKLLTGISTDTIFFAIALLLLSNLAIIPVYYFTNRLYGRTAAVFAAILYALMPARSFFIPMMDIITPLFFAIALWACAAYLEKQGILRGIVFGAAVYLLMFFDPMPVLFLLLFTIWMMLFERKSGKLGSAIKFIVIPVVSFAAVYAAAVAAGYDMGKNLLAIYGDISSRMADTPLIYISRLGNNTKDFLLGCGLPAAAAMAAFSFKAVRDVASGIFSPVGKDMAIAGAFWLSFIIMLLSGLAGAEGMREWLFLAIPVLAMTARRAEADYRLCLFFAALMAFQTVITFSSIGFVTL